MQTVGQHIRARRQALGLTLSAVSEAVGCAKGYLSMIENDRREHPPGEDLLRRLERVLRLDSGALVRLADWAETPGEVKRELMGLRSEREAARRLMERLRSAGVDALHRSGELGALVGALSGNGGTRGDGVDLCASLPVQVPLINRVAAGYPTEFTDLGYPARVADEYVSVPDVYDGDAFAARVVGDSMAPVYREGDIVVFSPSAGTPSGSDCFVRFERDAETTFKRAYFERDGSGREMIRLQPLNSGYPPRVVLREDVAGLYAAVYVVRPVGGGAGGDGG